MCYEQYMNGNNRVVLIRSVRWDRGGEGSAFDGTRQKRAVIAIIQCIRRESNPELGHGKTQCYRYTTNALGVEKGDRYILVKPSATNCPTFQNRSSTYTEQRSPSASNHNIHEAKGLTYRPI